MQAPCVEARWLHELRQVVWILEIERYACAREGTACAPSRTFEMPRRNQVACRPVLAASGTLWSASRAYCVDRRRSQRRAVAPLHCQLSARGSTQGRDDPLRCVPAGSFGFLSGAVRSRPQDRPRAPRLADSPPQMSHPSAHRRNEGQLELNAPLVGSAAGEDATLCEEPR